MILILQIAIGVALAPVVVLLMTALAVGIRRAGPVLWFAVRQPAFVGLTLAVVLWLTQFF